MNDSPRKPEQRRGCLRLIAFFLLPAAFIFCANRLLMKNDTTYYYTLLEMTHRDDIDVAFVGSSVVTYNIDPQVVTGETGLVAYDAGIGAAGLPTSVEIARQLFATNSPELVVLVIDAMTLLHEEEDIQAQIRMMSFIPGPIERMAYTLELAAQDGKYLDRLLPFKLQPVASADDVADNLELYLDPAGYAYRHDLLAYSEHSYRGQGHVCVNRTPRKGELLQRLSVRSYDAEADSSLFPFTQRKLLEFKALCEENGARLLVMFGPDMTVYRLSMVDYLAKYEGVADFCASHDMDFCDFTLARPEFLPCLDDYYYDSYHMNGEGARLFSEKLSEFLMLYLTGQPVGHLFYASQQEALDQVDFVTNVWLTGETRGDVLTVTAESNHGPRVTPEYRFTHLNRNGEETELRGYAEGCTLSVPGELKENGGCIVVYARPKDDPGQQPVCYEYAL